MDGQNSGHWSEHRVPLKSYDDFRHEKTAILGYLPFFVNPISIVNRLNPHS